jgi:hypothetical protein
MVNFNFVGELSNIEFGIVNDFDRKAGNSKFARLGGKRETYTRNKAGLITNLNNREIAANTVTGAIVGGIGAKSIRDTLKSHRTIAGITHTPKGGWKSALAGAALTGGLVGGGQLLLRKSRSDKGKKRSKI